MKNDLIGLKYNKMTVIERDTDNPKHGAYYWCQCECGNKVSVRSDRIKKGQPYSCGCVKKPRALDMTSMVGKKFGRLTVIERDLSKGAAHGEAAYWKCQCECGNIVRVSTTGLQQGKTKSCGCLRSELVAQKNTLDLTNKRYGKLTAIRNTFKLNDAPSYIWECKCDCGNICYFSAQYLQSGKANSCGCTSTISKGENKIRDILLDNNIKFIQQYTNPNCINSETNTKYRFDFAILNEDDTIKRLVEYDGVQHFERTKDDFFNFDKIKKSDNEKNIFALNNNIPLIRIPYYEFDNLSLDLLLSDKYLVTESEE